MIPLGLTGESWHNGRQFSLKQWAVTGASCLRQSDLRGLTEYVLLCGLPVLRQQHVQLLWWNHVYSR
ncbi:MAG: hypothetical protein OXF06_05965 [Bacteroidetes bacterium]|nr:hypothetical protein [Bacteroidota bacterium]